jgi:FkbM family methyltransferase
MSVINSLGGIKNRFSRYVAQYGVARGALVLASTVCGGGLVAVRLPGSKDSIQLRRHTSDIAAFEQVFIDGEYALPLGDGSPRVIVDAGANVGCASVYFARRFPRASIFAFEPESSNFTVLERNGKRYSNIRAIRGAIWNCDTELEIQNPSDDKWAFRVQEPSAKGTSTVPAFSMPAVMKMTGIDRIDILKVDIEGAEKELFDESSKEWIDRVGVIIIELHDWIRPGCSDALSNATRELRWERSRSGENTVLSRV